MWRDRTIDKIESNNRELILLVNPIMRIVYSGEEVWEERWSDRKQMSYWIEKNMGKSLWELPSDKLDEEQFKCDRCGRIWDGNAQCFPCESPSPSTSLDVDDTIMKISLHDGRKVGDVLRTNPDIYREICELLHIQHQRQFINENGDISPACLDELKRGGRLHSYKKNINRIISVVCGSSNGKVSREGKKKLTECAKYSWNEKLIDW